MKTELTLREMEAEMAVELPERQALATINMSRIFAINAAVAANIKSPHATATATANQAIVVTQFRDVILVH